MQMRQKNVTNIIYRTVEVNSNTVRVLQDNNNATKKQRQYRCVCRGNEKNSANAEKKMAARQFIMQMSPKLFGNPDSKAFNKKTRRCKKEEWQP